MLTEFVYLNCGPTGGIAEEGGGGHSDGDLDGAAGSPQQDGDLDQDLDHGQASGSHQPTAWPASPKEHGRAKRKHG